LVLCSSSGTTDRGYEEILKRKEQEMRNTYWIWLAVAMLVLATLACAGSDETTTPEPQPTAEATPTMMPTNTPKPEPTPTPEPEKPEELEEPEEPAGATIEITNESGVDIWYVFLSPSHAEEWGEDWLGDEAVIRDGQTHTITGIPEGQYDVMAKDENGEAIETWWEVDVEGEMTWTITGLSSLEVVNDTDDDIAYLYISPTDSDSWGEDWLGDEVIMAGDTYVVGDIPPGTYDVKAVNLDEESIEIVYNIDMTGERTWTVVGKTPLPDNAVLRFEDDFEDNRNNWGLDSESEDVFYRRPADGQYCILIKSENFTAWEWYEPFRTDEFVAEVACSLSGADDPSCGLGFGPDGDNIYWFEVSPSDQTFALFLLEDGEWQDNLVPWTVSRNINPTGTNYLSMQRVGGIVSLFVNSVPVEEVDSDRFPTGRVGLGGSTYEDGNATVCLDNLRVWRLE
jgi:hypothetical protein